MVDYTGAQDIRYPHVNQRLTNVGIPEAERLGCVLRCRAGANAAEPQS